MNKLKGPRNYLSQPVHYVVRDWSKSIGGGGGGGPEQRGGGP